MYTKLIVSALTFSSLSVPALAQGISGGELTAEAYGFNDGSDENSVNFSAGLEYSVNRNLSAAVDLSLYDSTVYGNDILSTTIHAIYHLNDAASVGFFAGRDTSDGRAAMYYGLEGGFEQGQFEAQGYLSSYDNSDRSTAFGLSGAYEINQSVSATSSFGVAEIDGQT